MVTREECERAVKSKEILEKLADLMAISLPGELIEHGETTSLIYAAVGRLDSIIKHRCKVK